jgi:Right handed beta helix region
MKKFTQLAYLSLLWVAAFTASASAQEAPRVSPNFEVRYTTEGAGIESNGSVEGFVPLFQTPGKNATFVQGKLFLDNDSQMGGNILFGHRIYDESSDRVTGGYVSLDARDTGASYFKQLGLGFETLGKWDFRINGYLPLGDTRNQVGQFYFGNPFFQGNNIFVQQANLLEVALHGVDAEVGTSLTKIGSGDLRGYVGAYYLGNDNKEAFGWKARVEARPTKFLALGASLQNDSLFDTRAVFTVGLSFPGSGSTRGSDEKPSNFARMGEFVERQAAIPVVGDVGFVTSPALTNPTTNTAWSFIHVAPGNSNGTFESPYGYDKIGQAVADAARTNSIVYIRGNANSIIPSFTLPSGVQLLTSAPEQFVNTVEFGKVKLPFSGSGVTPKLGGVITLSSNSVLSGLDINTQNGASVRGTNISNVTITDNRIQGTTLTGTNTATQGEAILLSQVTGNVDISNNTFNKNAGSALLLNNTSGNVNLKVTGNKITDNFNSIGINLGGTATGTAEIAKNTISNSGVGVDVSLSGSANLSKLNITDNTITAPNSDIPLEGIRFEAFDKATATVNVTGNTIRNTSSDGIGIELNNNTKTQINIANNKIENVKGNDSFYVGGAAFADGIDVQLFDSATAGISITGNTVNNTTGRGITTSNYGDAANLKLDITGNTVSNTEYQGIGIDNFNGTVNVNGNTVSNAYSEGIYLENVTGKVVINDNKVTNTRNPVADTDLESGIFVWNYAGNSDYTISNNKIETTFNATDYRVDGIEFNLCRDVDPIYLSKPCESAATANVNIINNTINHAGNVVGGADGIDLNLGQFANATFTVTGNKLSNIPDEGISINAVADSKGVFNINNNTITNVGDSGIEVDLFLPDPAISDALNLYNSSNTQFNITGNTIDAPKNDGIDFIIQDEANTKITITGNTIKNIGDGESGDRAIQLETEDSSKMCVAVDSNTISASPNPARIRANDVTSTLEVVNTSTLSTRNGGANITTSGTTNRSTACP